MKKFISYSVAVFFAMTAFALAGSNDDALIAKEKAAWQAFKDKKPDDFKKLVSADLVAVYAEGVMNMAAELDTMSKTDLKSFAHSDFKVSWPNADTAIVTYKVKTESSMGGQDTSGTSNCCSVWQKKNGEWQAVFHTDIKAAAADPAKGTDAQKKE